MNRLARFIMRLYPRNWRQRYGDELDALLTDTGADARVVADLFKGGMRMQLRTWPFPKLALALGLLGLLLGTGVAFLLPSVYVSRATLWITPAQASANDPATPRMRLQLNKLIRNLKTGVLSRTSLSGIVNDPRLQIYAADREEKPIEDVIEKMMANIRIEPMELPGKLSPGIAAFHVMFSYPDRYKAQQTVAALIGAFMAELQQLEMRKPPNSLSGDTNRGSLIVLDRAQLPAWPIYPKRGIVMLAGFAFGVLLASIWRLLQRKGLIARRFAFVAAAFGIAGLAAALLGGALKILPGQYRSTATLELREGNREQALEDAVFSRTSLSAVIENPRLRLYQDQLKTTTLADVIQTMKQHLAITWPANGNSGIFNVSFDYFDAYKAQQTVSAILDRFTEADSQIYPAATPAIPPLPAVMDVLDHPSLPARPTGPNRPAIAGTGGIAGIIVAMIVAIARRRWKPESELPADAVNG